MVDYLIMGDAQHPREEFAVLGIATVVDEPQHAYQRLLKDIVGHVAILDHHMDVIENPPAVTVYKRGYSVLIA